MKKLLEALAANFAGPGGPAPDACCNKTPKYGNDDDYADDIAKAVFEAYFAAIDGRPTIARRQVPDQPAADDRPRLFRQGHRRHARRPQGGRDPERGHLAGPGRGPQGPDGRPQVRRPRSTTSGPAARCSTRSSPPSCWPTRKASATVGHLVRSYFKMDGHHIQFNVVTADTLRDAQKHPEKYRDLIVRVAGYSDYFLDCSVDLQNEIIRRTEHMGF